MNNTETQQLTPDESGQMSDAAEPLCEFIQARQLVGQAILIVGTARDCGRPIAFVRKQNSGKLFAFYVGQIVSEQLRSVRAPTWATMQMVKSTKHPFFYKLFFAETTNVERIKNKCSEPLPQSGETPCKPAS